MNRWQEKLNVHPVWGVIDQIKSDLDVEVEYADDQLFAEKRRLMGTIAQIETVLKSIDPETVPFDSLRNFASHLSRIQGDTQTHAASPSSVHLQNINEYVTSHLLPEFGVLKALSNTVDQENQINTVKNISDEFARSMTEKTTELKVSVNSVRKDMEEQTKKVSHLGKNIDIRSNQLDELMNHLQDEFKKKMNGFLQEGENIQNKILELYGIVAGNATTSRYAKDAVSEGNHANIWRVRSIIFIVSTAVGLLSFIVYAIKSGGEISWNLYLPVASLTGVLLYGAAYSGQQSSRHRNSEQRHRQLALHVVAFEPFVSSLDDATKRELRKDVAASIFRSEIKDDVNSENFPIPLSVLSEIVKILDRSGK